MANVNIVSTRRAVFPKIGIAIVSGALCAKLPDPHPDADLLRLGRDLVAAWGDADRLSAELEADPSREADAIYAPAFDRVAAIVARIEALPAMTLDGLRIKAEAVAWCTEGRPLEAEDLSACVTTDLRLAVGIVNDLRALRV